MLVVGSVGCGFNETAAGSPTLTFQPAPSPTQVSPPGQASNGDGRDVLVARRLNETPVVDGNLEARWNDSVSLELPLTWGWDGQDLALEVELKSLYTDQLLCFAARWSEGPPSSENGGTFNKLTMHWEIPAWQAEERGQLDCTVVCHTSFADAQGRISSMNAETIPQGGSSHLPAAGQWESGSWTIEWCRPLRSDNPYDLQFTLLEADYPFRLKIFQRLEGYPDPVSSRALLRFGP